MDGLPNARSALASERTTDMTDMRKCIGSAKFGIAAHDAPVGDFPVQPSQKDGLGRMCKPHWREYTNALRKAALARQAAPASVAEVDRALADKPEGKARAAKPVSTKPARGGTTPATTERVAKVRKAKALIDAIDVLPGPEHVAAIATDEAQAALEALGTESHGEPVLAGEA
jgi:hypothetical protein